MSGLPPHSPPELLASCGACGAPVGDPCDGCLAVRARNPLKVHCPGCGATAGRPCISRIDGTPLESVHGLRYVVLDTRTAVLAEVAEWITADSDPDTPLGRDLATFANRESVEAEGADPT